MRRRGLPSLIALLCMMMVMSACGGTGNQTANPGSTPTIVGEIPTPTPDTTTPTPTTAPTAVPTRTALPMPTAIPVGNQVSAPAPTSVPVSSQPAATQPAATKEPATNDNMITVWVQVTDSCKQALPGGTFKVTGPGISTIIGPTSGSVHVTVPGAAGCPIPHGTCSIGVGCASVNVNKPSSGTATYKITIAQTAPGWGSNAKFAICEGGSDCAHGGEVATVQVNSSGSVSATTLNPYPDGTTVTYGPFTAANSDPIMFHEFGIAANTAIQCDGDSDADDYLTGTPGGHCDSDGDKK